MKINCSRSDLLASVNIAMRAVPSKSNMPILESLLITAQDDITITSNDNEMGIQTIVEGSVLEPGKTAVEARLFSEIVRKLPDNEITMETEGGSRLKIKCEDSVFQLSTNNPDEFPELPDTGENGHITISEFTLKEMIRQTIFSIAANDANALMKGELLTISGDDIKFTALDSHRIAIRNEKLSESYDHAEVIIPGKTLNEISRILEGNAENSVEIVFDYRLIKFLLNGTIVISRLIDGEFFNVSRMVSSDYSTMVTINKNDLINTLDRAVTLTREGERKPVVMEINDDYMNLDITSSIGSMNDRLPIVKEGNNLVIGFNPKFIMDALRVIDDEDVTLYFVNRNSPCFIRDNEMQYVYIILPVNINR